VFVFAAGDAGDAEGIEGFDRPSSTTA